MTKKEYSFEKEVSYIRNDYADNEVLSENDLAEIDRIGRPEFDTTAVSLDQIQAKSVDWLIDGYLPKNQIVVIGGDGGSGKTALWNSLVADFSAGKVTVFEQYIAGDLKTGQERKVMFFSSEDTIAEVLKPRINNYEAKPENILSIPLEDERFKDIKFGSDFLEALIRDNAPEVVVFDPLQSFLDSDVVMGSRNQMRNILNPLISLCKKYECTAIIIAHANKGKGVYGRKRLADSADIWDIARGVFLCGKADSETYYISQEKNNYGPRQKTLLYTLENGRINVKGFTDKHDYDYVIAEYTRTKTAPALDEAKEFILDQLEETGGVISLKDLDEAADLMSISKRTLRRAKEELKKSEIVTLSNGGYGSSKQWYLKKCPYTTSNMVK